MDLSSGDKVTVSPNPLSIGSHERVNRSEKKYKRTDMMMTNPISEMVNSFNVCFFIGIGLFLIDGISTMVVYPLMENPTY